jgi:hypothetical protein
MYSNTYFIHPKLGDDKHIVIHKNAAWKTFKNNLCLKESNWQSNAAIQDTNPFYGGGYFKNSGGNEITDYIPTNIKLIKDKGIEIPKIPKETLGLKIGLKVDSDIFGNQIIDKLDLGAIEL